MTDIKRAELPTLAQVLEGEPALAEIVERRPALKKHLQDLEKAQQHAEKYPNCAALTAQAAELRSIQRFFEWLWTEKKVRMVDAEDDDQSVEPLLMEYLEIDTKKLEEERRAMLEELQASNEKENKS